jgi:glyoxylase-like metal-dependent hydrolase (beta-lactamase superfamily II)
MLMETTELGSRGMAFEFKEPYPHNVYVINGKETVFVCDTACGPDSMVPVQNHIQTIDAVDKRVIVFNSHFHYDHIWGNCSFPEAMIISHRRCREDIPVHHAEAVEKYKDHMAGKAELVLPNVVFDDRLEFVEEGVVFYHSPGHTADSSTCLDIVDKVLFVGDNVEAPVPYLYEYNIDVYIKTLEDYLAKDWAYMIAGHDPILTDRELTTRNLDYLKRWSKWEIDLDELDEHERGHHVMNLAELAEMIPIKSLTPRMLAHYKAAKARLEKQDVTPEIEVLLEKFRNITSLS